jgi:hypothetical protein
MDYLKDLSVGDEAVLWEFSKPAARVTISHVGPKIISAGGKRFNKFDGSPIIKTHRERMKLLSKWEYITSFREVSAISRLDELGFSVKNNEKYSAKILSEIVDSIESIISRHS